MAISLYKRGLTFRGQRMLPSLQALVSRGHVSRSEPFIGAMACLVIPTVVRLAMMPALGSALPFATYFPTVLLATLLWGIRWGALVLVASGIIAAAMFIKPSQVSYINPTLLAAFALFITMGALILLTGSALRRALIELQTARDAEVVRKRELQHRLKNTLAIVQSFSSYLSRLAADKSEFHELLESRIIALANASNVLFAEQFETCALPETALAALAPFIEDERVSLHGATISLHADSCEPLVLALHELATNAHKYGALSADQGRVALIWSVDETSRTKCIIRWTESDGPVVVAPERKGLGQLLLRRQRGLDAVTINYEPSGLTCEMVVPVAITARAHG